MRLCRKAAALDESVYLHLQTTEGGYDYTLYDKDTLRQMDGGLLDAPELPLSTAALKICEMHDLGGQSIKYAPLAMIETLQEAAYQQMQEAAAQAAAPESTMLPDAPEQALDEYPCRTRCSRLMTWKSAATGMGICSPLQRAGDGALRAGSDGVCGSGWRKRGNAV